MGQVIVLDDGGHLDSFSNWVWKFIGLVCCISMLGLCRWISLFGVLIGFCGGCLGAVDPHILIRGRFWGWLSQLLSCCGEHHGSILMLRSLAFVRGRLCPSLAYRYQAFAAAKKHRRFLCRQIVVGGCGRYFSSWSFVVGLERPLFQARLIMFALVCAILEVSHRKQLSLLFKRLMHGWCQKPI